MIRNVIFDIGNVLLDFCWREHIAGCGYEGGMAERIGKAMMQSPVWNELDRGVWSEEEILNGFIKNDPELEQEIRHVFSNLGTIVRERSGSCAWVHDLKLQGYQVYYLSNYSEKIKLDAVDQLSFLKEMDGGIMSYMVQAIKPDEEIYRKLFQKYALKAEESVFLDDSPANLKASEALGMRGILVTSQEQARKELEAFLASNK